MDKQTYLDLLASAPPLNPSTLKGSVQSYREKVLSRLRFLLEHKDDDEEMTPAELGEMKDEIAANFDEHPSLLEYIPKGETINPLKVLRDNLIERAGTPVTELVDLNTQI